MSDEQLVIAVNKLAWRFLSHLGRNYTGTAPLHTLTEEDPRVRTAFDMATAAFEDCRQSDIESALAEAGDEVTEIDYSDVAPIHGVAHGFTTQFTQPVISEQIKQSSTRLAAIQTRLVAGDITLVDSLNELLNIQTSLEAIGSEQA
tara:strand:+ start:4365 stop:4802 length:438 start_codon:yes stop_codon:yes gene_type:complete